MSQEKSEAFEKWYKDAGSLDTVLKGLENKGGRLLTEAVYNLYSCYLRILAKEAGKNYTYITEKDRQTSKAITDNCMAGRIQGETAKKAVTEAVKLWYYNEDAYRFAIRTCGDEDDAIQEMGDYFGRNI